MKIISNFKDYYDDVAKSMSDKMVYKRDTQKYDRAQELLMARRLGYQSIELKPVRQILNNGSQKVVVYTDVYGHGGSGKIIMDLNSAKIMYPSKLCSKFYENNTNTFKLIQIGTRLFRVIAKNESGNPLKMSTEVKITEMGIVDNHTNFPIYSIDFVNTENGLLACDFNHYENLGLLGIDKIMTAQEVVEEIKNKLERLGGF